MSNKTYRIETYPFSERDAVLFDANVWLYIYGPQGELHPHLHTKYTLAFRRIRQAKVPIFIDVLVLSEFINAYARITYNNLPEATRPKNFKIFRNSDKFKPVAEQIAKYSRRLLSKCDRTHISFELTNMGSILSDYRTGEADFNDQMLAELCREKGLKLVTHDADFRGEDLTIITANSRIINY